MPKVVFESIISNFMCHIFSCSQGMINQLKHELISVLHSTSDTISSQFQYQKRCKKDTFCVVIPDEVGTSAYYCTNVLYEIPIQIWNPTVWKMEIATKIRNSTNTRHLMPFAEYPFQTEGSFLLGSNETTKLKVFFKSQYPADYVAELVVEAKSLRNNMDTRQESFVKSVKISANADDMHIVPFRMLPSG